MPPTPQGEAQLTTPRRAVGQEIGVVAGCDPDTGESIVRLDRMQLRARRAASCLLVEQPGDTVLVAVSAARCWILAILERHGGDDDPVHNLDLPGHWQVNAGRLHFDARQALELHAPEVALRSERYRCTSLRAEWLCAELHLTGDQLESNWRQRREWFDRCDVAGIHRSESLDSSQRRVAGLDSSRAGSVEIDADALLALHGGHGSLTAEGLLRMDGSQINVG